MGGCHFIGFTPDSEFLYAGVDYNGLAEELYSATLGQWGTDEDKVREVFVKAVGEPLKRLMLQRVESWKCVSGYLDCFRSVTKTGTYMELRNICKMKTLWEDPSFVSEGNVKKKAMASLEAAFKMVVEARQDGAKSCAAPTEGFLRKIIIEEMDKNILYTFGAAGVNYNDCMSWLLPMATLAPSLTHERFAEFNAADAVCR